MILKGATSLIENDIELDALTLVDLSLGYDYDDFKVRGFVNNVFDTVELASEIFEADGATFATYTVPRSFGVEVRYGFN